MKKLILVPSFLLASCIANTTPENASYIRISCSGASGGFLASTFGLGEGDTQYKQITKSNLEQITPEELEIFSNYDCSDNSKLALIRELIQ